MVTTDDRRQTGIREDWTDFVHTGPGTLAGRYMRRFWHPVQRSQDVPPGRTKPIRILGEDLTLYRGQGGAPHLVAFRCAHRGTQLSTGWVEGDNLRCFYHGWMYDPTGQCVEQPAEPEPFCQRVQIRAYPTREYLGLVFAYLGEGEPPEFPRYPDFEGEGLLEHPIYIRDCNFFNNLDNDSVHVYFVHRRPGCDWREWSGEIPRLQEEEDEWGVTTSSVRPGGGRSMTHRGMPNLVIRKANQRPDSPREDSLEWRVPIDDEHHYSFHVDFIHVTGDEARRHQEHGEAALARMDQDPTELAALILAGKLRLEDVDPTRTNLTNVQDSLAQMGQGPIADRAHEQLGRTDVGVILWRKIWERELRALAEGQPLKPWARSEGLTRSL